MQPFIDQTKSKMIEIYEILAAEIQQMINEVIDNPELILDNGESQMYSLTHLLTYSITHLLTHSLTHSLTYSLTYLLTHIM